MTVSAPRLSRRRTSLLGSSMLSSAALAAIAAVGVSLAPGEAEAAPCVAIGTSLYCNGPAATGNGNGFSVVDLGAPPPNGTGLAYTATGTQTFTNIGTGNGLTVTLENNGTNINTATGDGLDLGSDHTIILNDFGAITALAANGVDLETTTSTGLIGANINADITGGANGVIANAAGAADVNVNMTGTSTVVDATAAGGYGISATTNGGGVVVSATASDGFVSGGGGILASNTGGGTGSVSVFSSDSVTGTHGDAIQATNNGAGSVAVGYNVGTSTAQPITGAAIANLAGDGVDATNTGTGDVLVYTGFAQITGAGAHGDGINAVASGATANVTVDALDTNINGVLEGINAQGAGSGTVTVETSISPGVHIGTVGAISGSNGDGIFAENVSGTINIGLATNPIITGVTTATGITGDSGNGIFARTTAGGAINAYLGTGLYTGVGYNGLWLDAESGGNVYLNAAGSQFVGSISGVEADTIGSGTVTIAGTNIAASGGTGAGVAATSQNGDINIGSSTTRLTTGFGLGGDITSTSGDGVVGATIGNGSVNIYAGSGVFQSQLNAAGGAGIAALGESASGSGNLLVDLSGSSVQGDHDGVDVITNGTGSVAFNGLGVFVTGAGGRGLDIETASPTAGVSVNITDSALSGEFSGVFASAAGSGTVTVLDTITPGVHLVGTAGVIHASNGDGLYAASGSGTVNIGTALNPILTSNDVVNGITGLVGNGIVGKTTTGGAINLYIAGGLVTGTDNDGAYLTGGAGAVVTVSATNTNFNGAASGLEADTSGAGTVTINSNNGSLIGGTGAGITTTTQNGLNSVGASANRITTGITQATGIGSTSGDGIVAVSLGTGAVDIFTGAGLYYSNSTFHGSAAISGDGVAGGAVDIDMLGGAAQGGWDGVLGEATGASVTLNLNGAFASGADGSGVQGQTHGGDVLVGAADSVVTGSVGVAAVALTTGNVTVLDTISPGLHPAGTVGVIQGTDSDGVFALAATGVVNVGTALDPLATGSTEATGITGYNGDGIAAGAGAGGAVNLYAARGLITGENGDGALLDGVAAGVNILANLTGANLFGRESGLEADTLGAGTITIGNVGGSILGGVNAGVYASGVDGAINIGASTGRISTGSTTATGIGAADFGIFAAGAGAGAINIYTGAGLFYSTATTSGNAAIAATSPGGAPVLIDLLGSTLQGGYDGVAGNAFGATLTINAVDANIAGTNGSGVDAVTHVGDINIALGDTVVGGNAGVNAQALGTGNVTVLNTISSGVHAAGTAGVIQSVNNDAIFAQASFGVVDLGTAANPLVTGTTAATGITSQFADGVAGTAGVGGAVNLYSGAGLITGGSGDGANLQGAAGDNIVVNAQGTSYAGRENAIEADTLGTGTVNITSVGGALDGGVKAAIYATSVDGAINLGSAASRITTGALASTDANANLYALYANATGAGPVNIYSGNGYFITDLQTLGSFGLYANSAGGAATADLYYSTVVSYDAVSASSGAGAVTVNSLFSRIIGQHSGIVASGPGVVDVTLGADSTVLGANASAIMVSSGVGGANLQFSGSSAYATVIEGAGAGGSAAVETAQITGASTLVTNQSYSTITPITGHFNELAIEAFGTTGSVHIGNTGVIDGAINLSSLTDAGASLATSSNTSLNNEFGGVWNTAGTSSFGSGGVNGQDTLLNAGGIGTSGSATTFAFGAATTNSFTNSGTLIVGEAVTGSPLPYASTLTITHLQTFNNSGMIVLGDGAATPDRSLNAAGAAYTGSGAGVLQADAQLGGPGSTADTLNVGSTAGATSLLIRDVNAGFSGNTGPAGITLITTTGANAQSVTLNPGSSGYQLLGANAGLVKGLFFYSLVQQPTSTILVSALDAHAYDFTYLTSGAQQIWYATAPWQDRQADLRDSYTLQKGSTGGFEPGLWMKAIGDWADQKASVTPMPGFTFDTSYLQDTSGVIGGLDAVRHGKTDEALIGVSTGYVSSTMDFESGATRARYEGWTGGVYATYLNGPFFIDGDIKGDALRLSINEPGTFDGEAGANSIGGQVETGLRLPVGAMTLEPVGALAYVKTHIGDYVVSGTTVRIGDNESFRGSLGLRLSADLVSNDHLLLKLAGDARVWDEFGSGNQTSFLSSGPTIDVTDPIKGAFGETGLSLNLYSRDGHTSGFFNTSVKFKSGYTDDKVTVGFRYQWGGAAAH